MEHVERRLHGHSRARAKSEFYGHLAVYVLVNLLLVVINLVNWPGYFWAIWPILGWGIAVALHALRVFAFAGDSERLREEEQRRDSAGRK